MSDAIRVVFATGRIASNTLRYRVRMAEELLRSRGIHTVAVHSEDPLLSSWVDSADLLVVYRAPANRRLLKAVQKARSRGIPVTFDVDDLVFVPSLLEHVPFLEQLPAKQREGMQQDARLQEVMVTLVDRCSAATSPLVDALRTLTDVPCVVLPNGLSPLGSLAASTARRREDDGRVRLGYFSGSGTHDDDWALVEGAIADLLLRRDNVDLVLVGPLRTGPALDAVASRIQRRRPVPWRALPQLIADVDVNLAPLAITPFTEGKSALKWVEASAVGTPTIASATVPFSKAIEDGVTGVLMAPGQDWLPVLDELVMDPDRRRRIAVAASSSVMEKFGPKAQADRYEDFVRTAISSPRADVSTTVWSAAVGAAPHPRGLGARLEPYQFAPEDARLQIPAPAGGDAVESMRAVVARGRAQAGRTRDSVRKNGRRVVGGVRRRLGR